MTIYGTDANDLISDHRVQSDVAPVFAAPPEPAGAALITGGRRSS